MQHPAENLHLTPHLFPNLKIQEESPRRWVGHYRQPVDTELMTRSATIANAPLDQGDAPMIYADQHTHVSAELPVVSQSIVTLHFIR